MSPNVLDVRAFHNGGDVSSNIRLEGNVVVLENALEEGPNHFVVLALDNEGNPLSTEATIWAGTNSLSVVVNDQNNQPTQGTEVSAFLSDDKTVKALGITADGVVVFQNLPGWTIILQATASGNRVASLTTTGDAGAVTINLLGFNAPSAIANNDFSQGTSGWAIGSSPVQIIAHTEAGGGTSAALKATKSSAPNLTALKSVSPSQRAIASQARSKSQLTTTALADVSDSDLMVGTSGEGPQPISRTFNVASGTSSVLIRFRFITSEVPGGYFGSQYNDAYSVSVRSQSGDGVSLIATA